MGSLAQLLKIFNLFFFFSESMETTEIPASTSTPAMEVSGGGEATMDVFATDMVKAPEGASVNVLTEALNQESEAPGLGGHLDTAVTSTNTAVPSELPSARMPSDSTSLPASESSKVVSFCFPILQAKQSKNIPRSSVVIDFSQWLEAIFIALKYKRGLSPQQVSSPANGGERQPTGSDLAIMNNHTRYYTCSLDQVVEELDQRHQDGASFSMLFMVNYGCKLAIPSSLKEMMNSISWTTYRMGLDGSTHLQDERIPLMVWQSCAFTVHSIVVSAREAVKPLFRSLSSRQNDSLSTFIRFCGVVGSNFGEPKVIRSHSLKLLSTVLEVDKANPSIFEIDMFGALVSLTFSLPSLFIGEGPAPLPSCNIQDNHILRLVFLAHVTQLLFSMANSLPTSTKPDLRHCPSAKDCRPLLYLIEVVTPVKTSLSNEGSNVPNIDPMAVWEEVMEKSLGFLRCAALFYHYLSSVPAATELTRLLPADQEFMYLTKYLNIPSSPEQLLDSPYSLLLAKKWVTHPNVAIISSHEGPSQFLTAVPKLINLPDDYSELFKKIHSFSCPFSNKGNSSTPSLCLVCGMVVCSQSKCCQSEIEGVTVGASIAHSYKCSAGMCLCVFRRKSKSTSYLGLGLFLQLKECRLVMFRGMTSGCYVSPPYQDQYGEPDQGLKRGKPLTLSKER